MSAPSSLVRLGEWTLFSARALYFFVLVEIGLRTSSLPVVAARVGVTLASGQVTQARPPASAAVHDAFRVVRRVNRLSRWWPFGDTCLRRCLVGGAFLRPHRPQLWIGIDPRQGLDGLDAHAWLEIDGCSVDPSSRRFQTFSFE